MTGIIAGILALLIVAGGVIPNFTNSKIENSIKQTFNNPEKVDVKVYSIPSYRLLTGHYDRVEINVKKPKINNIEFDSIKMITSPLDIDYNKLSEPNTINAIKNGELETMLVISPENIIKAVDLNSLTTKANNFLSNFQLPIPVFSGQVSVDNLDVNFKNNKPNITGNFIAMGGLVTAPFTLSGDLNVTRQNTIELSKPQMTLYDEPLIMDEIGDMVKYINPVIDVNKMGNQNLKINLKRMYFKENKLKMIGLININN